jgi:hypothetical protein
MSAPGTILCRSYPTPVSAWAKGFGLVKVIGEREVFGHVTQKEVIVTSTGMHGIVDVGAVCEYDGENVVGFRPLPRRGEQLSFLPCDCEPPESA